MSYFLLGPEKTIYQLDPHSIQLSRSYYDPKRKDSEARDKKVFRRYDCKELVRFPQNTQWDKIQRRLSAASLDGFQFRIEIRMAEQVFQYEIENEYYPTLDSLIKICNTSIPREKHRRKYYLP